MSDASRDPDAPSPTAREAMHLTVDLPFDEAVDAVQLEHELADFETVKVTRLDQMIEGMLGDTVPRTALLVVCHPEIARDALAIDPTLAGLLPCTTVVYETHDDELVHVHHVSATKAIRDLGAAPAGSAAAIDALVELTGERMRTVWENIEAHVGTNAESS